MAQSHKREAITPWNLTEQTRSEQALRQSQARLSAVLETAVDAIITIDEHGRMQSVNPATTRMFGYSAAEMIGQNISMMMPQPYQQEHDGYIARYLQTGEKRIIGIGREVQGMRKDGTVFSADLAVSEVEPAKLFTGIIRDVSDRKLAEARLREADRMASIGALAVGLGHDMNNVLLPVRAHLNALKAMNDAPSNRLEHLEKIQKGVSYLQQLADGLHFLAMNPDRVEDVEGSTDLQLWWDQTGPLLSKAVPKHVKVVVSMPMGLPRIAVAAHALTQVALNLIVNAGEAIPGPPQRKRRQGYVRLWAELEPGGASIKLGVTDNGAGMTEEIKRRAVDMFFTTKPRGLGTGLGLPMVRNVVDRAGGSLEIQSEAGKGTTVALKFPVVDHSQRHENSRRVAIVRIDDGRAAGMVRNLLDVAGIEASIGEDSEQADLWIVSPTPLNLKDVASWWIKTHGKLILFGSPSKSSAAAWRKFEPVVVEDINDLDAVRAALASAFTKDE